MHRGEQRGILVFARIDFSADAPLQAAAGAGLDLAYNDPQRLVHRHGLASTLSAHLVPLVPLLEAAAQP